jgi:PhzF family phenazine biosynthesis protein
MQEIDFYLVDAFSDTSLAVTQQPFVRWKVVAGRNAAQMAQQHNQSETAYFVHTDDGFELRWFTTLDEINPCGHATLAAAHVFLNISTIRIQKSNSPRVLLAT